MFLIKNCYIMFNLICIQFVENRYELLCCASETRLIRIFQSIISKNARVKRKTRKNEIELYTWDT